ncbi:MAG: LptF/LptG family permease [Treponema sp.]|nr:LptF/LptG family permease [Treponema sp.]
MSPKELLNYIIEKLSSFNDKVQHKWISFKRFLKKAFIDFAHLPIIIKLKKEYNFIQVKVFKKGTLTNHILVRYLFKDLFLYFLVSFLFFFMIFFVNQILLTVEDLLAKSAPFKDVMRIMWYSLPFIIAQSAPFATLVGFLMSLGAMMSSNEILIFRAAGFSFIRILIPVAALGLIISIASFFVNDYLLPLGTVRYNKLMREIMHSTPSIELESNSVKRLDKVNVVIGEVSENTVSDIILFDSRDEDERIIVAGNSVLVGAKEEGVLMQLNMDDSTVFSLNRYNRHNYDVMKSEKTILNIFDSTILGSTARSAREMTTYDLSKVLVDMRKSAQEDPSQKPRLNIWTMEFHKKFALPFGSIFFAFLAFSIAFLFGKHNGQMLGLFLGIVICVLYWAMQIMGQLFVTRVGLPAFWCIWLPDFLIGAFGIGFLLVLLRK